MRNFWSLDFRVIFWGKLRFFYYWAWHMPWVGQLGQICWAQLIQNWILQATKNEIRATFQNIKKWPKISFGPDTLIISLFILYVFLSIEFDFEIILGLNRSSGPKICQFSKNRFFGLGTIFRPKSDILLKIDQKSTNCSISQYRPKID